MDYNTIALETDKETVVIINHWVDLPMDVRVKVNIGGP